MLGSCHGSNCGPHHHQRSEAVDTLATHYLILFCSVSFVPLQKRLHELKGRRLDAKAAVPKAHLGNAKLTKKMFVGGTGELTDADFQEHFSQYGEIEDAAVGFLCMVWAGG